MLRKNYLYNFQLTTGYFEFIEVLNIFVFTIGNAKELNKEFSITFGINLYVTTAIPINTKLHAPKNHLLFVDLIFFEEGILNWTHDTEANNISF